jgi:glutathione S-transferase
LFGAGKSPFGQLPLYEEPGLTLVQSAAITRYLAKKHGFAGTNDHEAALIDQAYEGAVEIVGRLVPIFRLETEEQKTAAKAKLVAEYLPTQLGSLSKLLEKNGNNGFFVGSKLSYADLGLWIILSLVFNRVEGSREVAEKIPTLKAFLDGVAARDKVKAYLARDVYAKKE